MSNPNPLSTCSICQSFGYAMSANYMNFEMPPDEVFALEGLVKDYSGQAKARSQVYCPECETEYWFYEETEHMMYSVAVGPKTPRWPLDWRS